MLEVRKSIGGLSVKATALEQKVDTTAEQTRQQVARVDIKADGISSTVQDVQRQVDTAAGKAAQNTEELAQVRKDMTSIQQNADSISVLVQNIIKDGVSKLVNELGLTIDGTAVTIHRPGNEMTNNLDETGMHVIRSKGTSAEAKMLQANADGVVATDVEIRNFLIMGDHARFENYSNGTDTKRTACFWIDD